MKPQAITILFTLVGVAVAHNPHHAQVAKRQNAAAAAPTGTVVAGVTIPPLASITFGMPTASTPAATATATPGAAPPFSGAPPLPSPACKSILALGVGTYSLSSLRGLYSWTMA